MQNNGTCEICGDPTFEGYGMRVTLIRVCGYCAKYLEKAVKDGNNARRRREFNSVAY